MKPKLHRLYDQQGGRCFYCDRPCWLRDVESKPQARLRLGLSVGGAAGSRKALGARMATYEHLQRKIDGGRRDQNLAMACFDCNSCRGDATVHQHKLAMMMRYQGERQMIARAQDEALGTRSSG